MKQYLKFFVPSTRRGKNGKYLALPGRNELEAASRSGYQVASRLKRTEGQRVAEIAAIEAKKQGWKLPQNKVIIHYLWVEPNDHRDQDNITGYEKCLLDGLTPPKITLKNGKATGKKYGAGIIADDSQKYIYGCSVSTIEVSKSQPGVFVTIKEVEENGI